MRCSRWQETNFLYISSYKTLLDLNLSITSQIAVSNPTYVYHHFIGKNNHDPLIIPVLKIFITFLE